MDNNLTFTSSNNGAFYITINTYILGLGASSKYMEYQDVAAVIKDVLGRQKLHSSDYLSLQLQDVRKSYLSLNQVIVTCPLIHWIDSYSWKTVCLRSTLL